MYICQLKRLSMNYNEKYLTSIVNYQKSLYTLPFFQFPYFNSNYSLAV